MFHLKNATVPVAAVLCFAGPLSADVTADDVWNDISAYMAGIGYRIDGQETRSGNTLSISDIRITGSLGPDTGSMVIQLDSIELAETGGGAVDIILPPVVPVVSEFTGPDDETFTSTVEYRHSGLVARASGTPAEMLYTYTADTISVLSNGPEIDGTTFFTAEGDLTGISGTTTMTLGGTRVYDQQMAAAGATYQISFADPEGDGEGRITGEISDLTFEGTSDLPALVSEQLNMSEMLAAGFSAGGNFRTGPATHQVTSNSAEADFNMNLATGETVLDVEMSGDGLSYGGTQSDLVASYETSALPFPIAFAAEDSGFELGMPLRQSEEPADFALLLSLEKFTMDDFLWNMFDSASRLPRDPATLVVDLAGKATVLFDFLDPASIAAAGEAGDAPADIDSLDVRELRLEIAGASLQGEGSFEFPETDMPFPRPVGGVDLSLVGGNGLIDNLVAIGLLPEEQAMAARMMMGLLAVPGDAPDTLTSRIEMNEQGHIIANGQRIQ